MNAISVLNVYLNLTNHIVVGKQGEKRAQFLIPIFVDCVLLMSWNLNFQNNIIMKSQHTECC